MLDILEDARSLWPWPTTTTTIILTFIVILQYRGIDPLGIITFTFLICVTWPMTSLQQNLQIGGRLEDQVLKNRISVASFPPQASNIETSRSFCCQVTNIYYFVLIYKYIYILP